MQLYILPSGKIINWNNNLYYGNQQQIANNTQITSLQSQINNLLGGNKLIFLQKTGNAIINYNLNYSWSNSDDVPQVKTTTIYNFPQNGYTPILYSLLLTLTSGCYSVKCNSSSNPRYDNYSVYVTPYRKYNGVYPYYPILEKNDVYIGGTYIFEGNLNPFSLYHNLNNTKKHLKSQSLSTTDFTNPSEEYDSIIDDDNFIISMSAAWRHNASYSSGNINANINVNVPYYLSALCVIN